MDTTISQLFGPTQYLGSAQIIFCLLLSFILCSVIAFVYRKTHHGFSYSRSFVHTIILCGIVASILIVVIGNNLARGLGILGTLALIRFRTHIRDPRDIVFLFATLAIGIACGAGVWEAAIIGALFFCGVVFYLDWSPFASRREFEGLLRFILPPDSPSEEKVREALRRFCQSYELIGMREAAQGDLVEYSYHVRLRDPSYQRSLIDGMRTIEQVSDASLIMHRATVEL